MLRKNITIFSLVRIATDISVISTTWILAYFLRFHSGLFGTPKGIPAFQKHMILIFPVVGLSLLACTWTGLYKSRFVQRFRVELVDLAKTSALIGLLVMGFLYYLENPAWSRLLVGIFVAAMFPILLLSSVLAKSIAVGLHLKGKGLRYYAVIGAGKKGQQLVRDLEQAPWLGLKCGFFLDNNPSHIGTRLRGIPVYSPIENASSLVDVNRICEVYLTCSGDQAKSAYPILAELQSKGVTIRIVPDWGSLVSTHTTVIPVGSQLLYSGEDSPLSGWNLVLKELFDRTVSLLLLIPLLVPMALISLLIKLTSKGPVLYRQTRIGLDQKEFTIYKFRTLKVCDDDQHLHWSCTNDSRRTKLGALLRKTSIDELPQFINVLMGQMSLVGPRPECPYFANKFSEEYANYMLRHKVKAGMTGWAQIHGFRGDSSLKKRLQYDLYYVRKWSFSLDMRILLTTPLRMLRGKNAH